MSEEEKDGLAAEYVLGTLDASERSLVDARRKTDASLSASIEAWQRRLAPLSDRMPGVAPPSHLLDGILSRISTLGAPHQRAWRRWVHLYVTGWQGAVTIALPRWSHARAYGTAPATLKPQREVALGPLLRPHGNYFRDGSKITGPDWSASRLM